MGKATITLATAADAYIATLREPSTARTCRHTLRPLVSHFGPEVPVSQLEPASLASWFQNQWGDIKASTWNNKRSVMRRFFNYCHERGWSDPGMVAPIDRHSPRRYPPDPRFAARVTSMVTDSLFSLRERALWGVVFDCAAKAWEVLALDVPDIDLAACRARLPSSGFVSWTPETNSLLAELLEGRQGGPVFLARGGHGRARLVCDLDPASGRSRLSYERAQQILAEVTVFEPGGSLTFRQLREGRASQHGWTP
jgi:integrase